MSMNPFQNAAALQGLQQQYLDNKTMMLQDRYRAHESAAMMAVAQQGLYAAKPVPSPKQEGPAAGLLLLIDEQQGDNND